MEKNKVVLVSPFVNPFRVSNSRVFSVAEVLTKNGLRPIIITANFNHELKEKYNKSSDDCLFETILIDVPKYCKNLSLLRAISHIVFAYKVNSFIRNNVSNYKFVYCTTPSTIAPYLLSKLCRKNNTVFVLDVIDLWPQSYYIFFGRLKFIIKFLLYPWFILTKVTYKQSSFVIAASKEYAKFVSQFRTNRVECYYLGVDTQKHRELLKSSKIFIPSKKDGEIWIGYGGSLNNSYDFDVIISSFSIIQQQFHNIKLLFVGGGELELYIKNSIIEKKINGLVTGILSYPDYLKMLSNCDIAINSFRENTLVAHSYKFNDYVASGCCILNNLKGETWLSVEENKLGLNFDYEKFTLAHGLQKLLTDPDLIRKSKINSKNFANNELSKVSIYNNLFKDLNNFFNNDL
jgi:glycosyltransferase involved in cell wall biosynthesis